MRIRFYLRCLLISAVLFSLPLCHAQTTVPGTVTFNFGTNSDEQLWDLSGSYNLNFTINQRNNNAVPVQLAFNLTEDAAGNLHGVANDFQAVTLNGSLFTVTYTINGKVTGSGGAATTRFTVHMTGNGNVGGLPNVGFSAILVVEAAPNLDDGQLEGVAKFSAHLGGGLEGVSGTIPDFATALPAGVNGTWTLTMQLLNGNSLDGSAVITTDAGQTLGFKVSGPITSSAISARLRGSGAIANTSISGVGSSATIFPTDATFDSITLSGKLMGQKLVFAFPPSD